MRREDDRHGDVVGSSTTQATRDKRREEGAQGQ